MPELPEVETVRRGLEAQRRRPAHRARRGRPRAHGAAHVGARRSIDGLTGATIDATSAAAASTCSASSTPATTLMIHLRMSGRVLIAAPGDAAPPHTHVVLAPARASPPQELWFVDPRTFGEVVVFDPANAAVEMPELRQARASTRSPTG